MQIYLSLFAFFLQNMTNFTPNHRLLTPSPSPIPSPFAWWGCSPLRRHRGGGRAAVRSHSGVLRPFAPRIAPSRLGCPAFGRGAAGPSSAGGSTAGAPCSAPVASGGVHPPPPFSLPAGAYFTQIATHTHAVCFFFCSVLLFCRCSLWRNTTKNGPQSRAVNLQCSKF